MGVKNFFEVGIFNWWDRISTFFGNLKTKLFGKKGVFKNAARTKATLIKILLAWCIGQTKQMVGGWIAKLLLKVVKFIPGWG